MVKFVQAYKGLIDLFGRSLHKKTHIICSIGMNNSKAFLNDLIANGMNIARLNFSHGDLSHHSTTVNNLRQLMQEKDGEWPFHIGIMQDIRGPKIRIGLIEEEYQEYQSGEIIKIELVPPEDINNYKGSKGHIYCDYVDFPTTVKIGGLVYIDDGFFQTVCTAKGSNWVEVKALNSYTLTARKGVLIPGEKITLPAVTDRDKIDLQWGVQNGVDFVAASFVRKAEHIYDVREVLGSAGENIKVIAKIENQEALDNIDSIIRESDGIMVARGDLGTELPPEKIFRAQKAIIRKCNLAAKPVITATQMLESMTVNPLPTRAECTDVANAIIDGTDCVMLSGETAKGKFPALTVKTMSNICLEAEQDFDIETHYVKMNKETKGAITSMEVMAANATRIAEQTHAKIILVISNTTQTLRWLTKFRPSMPILVITNDERNARQCLLFSDNRAFVIPEKSLKSNREITDALDRGFRFACDIGLVDYNDYKRQNIGVCLYDSSPLDYHDDVTVMNLLHFKY